MKLKLINITYKNFKETHIGNSFLNDKLKIELSETNQLFTFNK